ncbi:tetratricopeptide repeat protein [Amnibacterium soli]|uniref:Tetratricopeptide repeat protein n=1 Tax=Amnibacterium soli TaxID=1282736 RepID=A0ABP8Z459_9MICO
MAAVPAPPPGGLRGAIDLSPLVSRQNQQAAQAAQARQAPAGGAPEQASGLVVEIGDAEFPQLIELSSTVPVVVALVASWSTPSQELVVSLRRVVESAAGRLLLAIVDADASPQIAAAFQAQSIPTVVAVIAGGPVPLFAGVLPEERMAPLFEQVLELAAQNGVTGTVPGAEDAPEGAAAEPEPEPLPPLHQEAYAAIDRQDYAEAARLFRTAIAQDPRDAAAVAALAQVELLDRLQTVPADARTAAAADPKDVPAALAVADLDVAGGHVDDAFDRLLDAFAGASGDDRTVLRTRLLDYFALTGADDPRVAAARRRLAMLLY